MKTILKLAISEPDKENKPAESESQTAKTAVPAGSAETAESEESDKECEVYITIPKKAGLVFADDMAAASKAEPRKCVIKLKGKLSDFQFHVDREDKPDPPPPNDDNDKKGIKS